MLECNHPKAIENDALTHWQCVDCGSQFPLIGDDDSWAPTVLLAPVARAQEDARRKVYEGDVQGALDVWRRFAEGRYDR